MNELDLFVAAQAITDPTERADYLNRVCGGNTLLRERLEAHDGKHARDYKKMA